MEEGTKTGQNRKAVYIVAALCALSFLGGIGGMIWNMTRSHGRQVEILQDGKILYTLDLAQAEDQTFTVTYGGRTNEIEIRDHQIRVKAADCPDQICVHQGYISDGSHRVPAESAEHSVCGRRGRVRAGRGVELKIEIFRSAR